MTFNNATVNHKVVSDDDRMKKSCRTSVSKTFGISFHPKIILIIMIASKENAEYIMITLCSDLKNTYLILQRNKNMQNNTTFVYSHKRSCAWNISDSGDRWGNTGFLGRNNLKVTNVYPGNNGKNNLF